MALSSASIKAGMAFSNTETALAHALSYRITIDKGERHQVTHRVAEALGLQTVCE